MKKISSILVLTILISSLHPMGVQGAEPPTLSVAQATTRAINNSAAIRNLEDTISLTREGEQRIRDVFWASPFFSTADFVSMQSTLMRQEAARAVSQESITVQRATLEFLVANHFSNIIMAQNELKLFDENLAIMEQDLNILQVMVSLGMASASQYNLMASGVDQARHSRAQLQTTIDTAFRELNRLMGTSQTNIYNLIFEIEFNPLEEINLARYIANHTRDNVGILNARNQLSIAQFELNNHTGRFDPITGEVLPDTVTRGEREIFVNQARRDLNDTIQNVENAVADIYTQIRQIELAIEATTIEMAILLLELSVLEVQYYIGHITRLDIDKAYADINRLEEQQRRQKVNHSLLVMQLVNSNIAIGF